MHEATKKFDYIIECVILFLFLFVPFREILAYVISPLIKIIPDILILSLLAVDLIKNKKLIRLNAIDLAYLLFLLIAMISTLYNGRGIKPFIVEARSITMYYFIYFIVRDKEFSERFLINLRKIIRFNIFVLFFFGVIEKIFDKTVLFPIEWYAKIMQTSNFHRVYSYFKNPNTYGAFLVLSFYILVLIDKKYNIKDRWTYALNFCSLLMTASRSSLLVLVVCICIYAILFRSRQFIKETAILIALGCLIFVGVEGLDYICSTFLKDNAFPEEKLAVILDRLEELRDEKIVELSNIDGRIYSIKTGIKVFNDNKLLGAGFGTYGDAASLILGSPIYEKYDIREGFYSDNEYIKIIAETGILGTIAYIGFLASILYYLIKLRNFYMLNLYIMILSLGLFYNVFEIQIISLFFWLLAGLLLRERSIVPQEKKV